jgi:hypothetical protein
MFLQRDGIRMRQHGACRSFWTQVVRFANRANRCRDGRTQQRWGNCLRQVPIRSHPPGPVATRLDGLDGVVPAGSRRVPVRTPERGQFDQRSGVGLPPPNPHPHTVGRSRQPRRPARGNRRIGPGPQPTRPGNDTERVSSLAGQTSNRHHQNLRCSIEAELGTLAPLAAGDDV